MIKSNEDDIFKLICLRKLYAVSGSLDLGYHLISSLLHKHENPQIKNSDNSFSEMIEIDINLATVGIMFKLPLH